MRGTLHAQSPTLHVSVGSYAVPIRMTEQEFVHALNLISNEVETAFIAFQSYEELNQLALTDSGIFEVLNADAMFWQGYRSTLLTALFMTTSRLFDPVSGAI